ncbi:MAG: flagellar hook assembly protein FlgD [Labrys sp. (in: a-proteobacteria)]|jgi:flagellar basal-body rod modification protein FlgD
MATVTSTSSASSNFTSSVSSSRQTIAGNFDQFLSLLTTQLQNQNPLDPLDTNQFTQQLVQFSQVEQQLKTNEMLASLADSASANRAASTASYLGAEITADGSKTSLKDGKAGWAYNAARAGTATFSVIDKSGATIYSTKTAVTAGTSTFNWDGRTTDGSLKTSGEYTIRIDAKDVNGLSIKVTTEIAGKVDAIDLSGSVPVLKIGSIGVSLDQVKSLRKAGS